VTSPTGVPGRLLVVATPIGNLEDLAPRALAALRDASLVLCEDTRRTGNLFARYGVTTPRASCHEHNEFRRIPEVLARLAAGETLALVSDAGTPGVSDPGRLLAAAVSAAGYRIEPIAGPSAVAAILSISGFPAIPFSFLGFPPSRHGERSRWYARFASRDETRILFESPFRVVASLEEMARAWGDPQVCLGREMTKLHEEVLRGSASAVAALLAKRPGIKGEIAVAAAPSTASTLTEAEAPRSLPGEDGVPPGPDEPALDDDSDAGE
jgi:16S rRNA (cytidine1402-2'-O)-methyltransferase